MDNIRPQGYRLLAKYSTKFRLLEMRMGLHLVHRGFNTSIVQQQAELRDGHVRCPDVPCQPEFYILDCKIKGVYYPLK